LSFDIFENKRHATRVAGLTQKTFFIFFIFEKSVVWREQSIRHPKHLYDFLYFWKGVSCDASSQSDTKTIFI